MTTDEVVEYIARAIWEQRRKFAGAHGIRLEEWGDGSIPRANGVFEEARAAYDAWSEIDPTR